MIAKILELLVILANLIKDLKPSLFEKKEKAKKEADEEGQSFFDKRNM